jgi:hypothetical protein
MPKRCIRITIKAKPTQLQFNLETKYILLLFAYIQSSLKIFYVMNRDDSYNIHTTQVRCLLNKYFKSKDGV